MGSVDPTCRMPCMSVRYKGGERKREREKVMDGTVVESSIKKFKLVETSAEKTVDTITIEHEISVPADKVCSENSENSLILNAIFPPGYQLVQGDISWTESGIYKSLVKMVARSSTR